MEICAIVIDDEKKNRQLLTIALQEYCPQVLEIYEAEDLLSGVAMIKKYQPQIVFLDIEMPEHSGLQILNFIDEKDLTFEIVFTTAYREYGIEAFQFSAIDYLLKPLRPQLIKEAVTKAEKVIGKKQIYKRLQEPPTIFRNNKFNKVALPVADGILFLDLDDIICFKADGMYTKVYSISEGELLISKPLKHFNDMMIERSNFYKPHRSFIININHIKQYIKTDGGYILMDNNMTVSISKEKREEFLKLTTQC
ncbi:LytTR family DNA-binding domain-containing protein [uncultured Aquimarina sp.]|uniref:LytR/AlgR family response regulator transcription factor n=1 Tax=uncultured Aquimarina sp. TaxID=575652 RepID=UPI002631B574|nr:response regulator transcription factor [uncultured Aquimarina sp.]